MVGPFAQSLTAIALHPSFCPVRAVVVGDRKWLRFKLFLRCCLQSPGVDSVHLFIA